jgi:TolB-like protein
VSEGNEIPALSEAIAQPAARDQSDPPAQPGSLPLSDLLLMAQADATINLPAGKSDDLRRPRGGWRRRRLPIFFTLLALALVVYYLSRPEPSPPGPIRAIAVLPFVPLNSDANQEYLGLGIADDLITRLSSTRQIVVRPMSLVIRRAGGEQDPLAIGRTLLVDAIVTGTVRKANELIRVNARLIRVSDGVSLWEQIFDVKLADLLAMQDHE